MIQKRRRGRPPLTPEQKLARQKAKIASLAEKKKKPRIPKKADQREETVTITKSTQFLLTPSGKCPVPLFGNDKEAITVWARQFHNTTSNGALHTQQSIEYWLRDFFSIHSEEHKIAAQNLKEACQEIGIKDYQPHLDKIYERVAKELEDNKQKCNIDV